MRILSIALMMLMNVYFVNAQTLSLSDIKPSKEALKTAKKMQKEGWNDYSGQPMEKLLELSYRLAVIPLDGQISSASCRYILATSQENAPDERIARQKAETSCQAQIAQSINAVISALVNREMTNQQQDLTEADTEETVRSSTETISKAHLQKCFQVWEFVRKEDNGSFSVQMMMAFDKAALYKNK